MLRRSLRATNTQMDNYMANIDRNQHLLEVAPIPIDDEAGMLSFCDLREHSEVVSLKHSTIGYVIKAVLRSVDPFIVKGEKDRVTIAIDCESIHHRLSAFALPPLLRHQIYLHTINAALWLRRMHHIAQEIRRFYQEISIGVTSPDIDSPPPRSVFHVDHACLYIAHDAVAALRFSSIAHNGSILDERASDRAIYSDLRQCDDGCVPRHLLAVRGAYYAALLAENDKPMMALIRQMKAWKPNATFRNDLEFLIESRLLIFVRYLNEEKRAADNQRHFIAQCQPIVAAYMRIDNGQGMQAISEQLDDVDFRSLTTDGVTVRFSRAILAHNYTVSGVVWKRWTSMNLPLLWNAAYETSVLHSEGLLGLVNQLKSDYEQCADWIGDFLNVLLTKLPSIDQRDVHQLIEDTNLGEDVINAQEKRLTALNGSD